MSRLSCRREGALPTQAPVVRVTTPVTEVTRRADTESMARVYAVGCSVADTRRAPDDIRGSSPVRDTGIEPVTSSVSGKRATAAPIAPMKAVKLSAERWRRDSNPCKRLCRPVPSHSATPPEVDSNPHARTPGWGSCTRADDETRTRDPNLGKVVRYQLRYIRMIFSSQILPGVPGTRDTLAQVRGVHQTAPRHRACPPRPHHPATPDRIRDVGHAPRIGYAFQSCHGAHHNHIWAIGAVGSALPSHGRGRRFESGIAHADVAQLVAHNLAKVGVASSSLVIRSTQKTRDR